MFERVVQTDAGPVKYWVSGNVKLPWLIATDGGGLDHRLFLSLAEHLREHFQVLLWDLPGHGDSQPLAATFTLDLAVAACERILDAERIDSAVFLGFSFGGIVHQLLAARRPGVFKAMILYACLCPSIKPLPIPRWLVPVLIWAMFGRQSWDQARAVFVKQSSNREEVRRQMNTQLERTGRDTFLTAARAMMVAAGRPLPARWQAPTLFIYGALDPHKKDFASTLTQLQRTYPDAVITEIEGAAHSAHADEPDAFNRSLDKFLQRL